MLLTIVFDIWNLHEKEDNYLELAVLIKLFFQVLLISEISQCRNFKKTFINVTWIETSLGSYPSYFRLLNSKICYWRSLSFVILAIGQIGSSIWLFHSTFPVKRCSKVTVKPFGGFLVKLQTGSLWLKNELIHSYFIGLFLIYP